MTRQSEKTKATYVFIVKETYALCKLDHPDVKVGNKHLHN